MNDLLSLFKLTENHAIRDQIAFIFAETHFDKALPVILEKIKDPSIYNHTGTLVYSLEAFDLSLYLDDLIKIIIDQSYESKITVYAMIENYKDSFSSREKELAINKLNEYQNSSRIFGTDTLILINKTAKLLEK